MSASAAVPLTPAPVGWRRAFTDLTQEHGFEPLRVEGALPADLNGTLYRNGPALFGSHGEAYRHWFDGDGAVSAVRFAGGKAEGAIKVVQSAGLLEERRAGKRLHGGYGTPPAGNVFQRLQRLGGKNSANTSVIGWQGRLFALNEGGRPTELSPADLSTLGETDLNGVVLRTFSAHPHRTPQRKASYNFGMRHGPSPAIDIYEMPDAGPARHLTAVTLSGGTMIHDFIVTPRYLIFFAPPLRMRLPRFALGLKSYGESLAWKPSEGTEVIVVPIDAPESVVRFTVEGFYQWHFTNAFERADGTLAVEYVRLPNFDSNAWLGTLPQREPTTAWDGRYHRAVLDLKAKTLRSEQLWDVPCEFPRIASRVIGLEHRYAYLAANSPEAGTGLFDRVAKLDATSGAAVSVSLGAGQYPGEPVFVRREGSDAEDGGYLLVQVYDSQSHEAHVAVLDAAGLEAPPLARAYFGHHVPFSFHGNFVHA